jgi:hypothetical protein
MAQNLEKVTYNLLTIKPTGQNPYAKTGKIFQAYIQDEVAFRVGVGYQTIFSEVVHLASALNKIKAALGIAVQWLSGKLKGEELGGMIEGMEKFLMTPFSSGIAWTRKFGGLPEYITFAVKCTLVNFESEEEVFTKLNDLYDITVPRIAFTAGKVDQMECMVSIGTYLIFKEAFVTDIDHRFSKMSVNGVPLSVDLSLNITTKYIVDRNFLGVQGKKIEVREIREVMR